MKLWESLKRFAQRMRHDVLTVYFAARDARTPFLVRLLAFIVAAYALSPIDLIPDFIPMIGYLDELLLLPLGIVLVLRLTPEAVIEESRVRANAVTNSLSSRGAAVVIVAIWALVTVALLLWLF